MDIRVSRHQGRDGGRRRGAGRGRAARGHRGAGSRPRHRGHRRLAVRVPRAPGRKRPGIDWTRTVFFHLDEYVGLPDTHPASFRKLPARAHRGPRAPGRVPLHRGRRRRPRRGMPARGRDPRPPPDRRRVRGHRRERPPRVQRSARRLRDRGALPRGGPRRGLPAPAAGRGLVREPRGRAAARDLHVDPADPEVARDPLHRAGRAQGAGRSGNAWRARSARGTPRRSLQRHPRTTVFLDAPAAALLEPRVVGR